jgi:hypothetical protein
LFDKVCHDTNLAGQSGLYWRREESICTDKILPKIVSAVTKFGRILSVTGPWDSNLAD